MYDPDLKYCPHCNDEYRAEIEKCAACNVSLLSGADIVAKKAELNSVRNSRKGELQAGDDIVTIHKGSMQDLRSVEQHLKDENIGYLIMGEGDGDGCGKGCCSTTFLLQVRREDAMDAMKIIEHDFNKTTAISSHDTCMSDSVFNPSAGEATCPACGFAFQTSANECPDCGLCFS